MRHSHTSFLISVLLIGVVIGCLTTTQSSQAWDELWMPKDSERTDANWKRYQNFPLELKALFQDRCEAQLTAVRGERPTHAEMSDCISLVVDAFYANHNANRGQFSRQTESGREGDVPRHAKQAAIQQCQDSLEVMGIESSSWWLNACIKQELRSYQKLQRDYGDVLNTP